MSLIDNIDTDNAMALDDWGVPAVFECGASQLTVKGLWNNAPTRSVQMLDGSVQTIGPSFSFVSSALDPQLGQAVTIDNTVWEVVDIVKEGIGWTTIELQEAN
jgi:hypothetical protein